MSYSVILLVHWPPDRNAEAFPMTCHLRFLWLGREKVALKWLAETCKLFEIRTAYHLSELAPSKLSVLVPEVKRVGLHVGPCSLHMITGC
jgi:hypothetical protein